MGLEYRRFGSIDLIKDVQISKMEKREEKDQSRIRIAISGNSGNIVEILNFLLLNPIGSGICSLMLKKNARLI